MNKIKFGKWIVLLVIILNIIFTAVVLWVFCRTGSEPSSLIGAWFGFTTIELWALAGIKKKEVECREQDESGIGEICKKNTS